MAPRKSPFFDTATTLGKIVAFLGISALCGVLAAGLLVPAAAVAGVGATSSIEYFDQLPAELNTSPLSQASKIYSADGKLIATFYAENRVPVKLEKVSQHMLDAIVSIEDVRFYEHNGVDPQGIMRAAVSNLAGGSMQGASTLTMQYVNNVLIDAGAAEGKSAEELTISGTKSIGDKLREAKLAIALEKKYSKEEILQGYLNIVLFSGQTYGIEAAARTFFGKHASELNIAQSAMLAGMVQSPNYFNPVSNPEATKQRRDIVLAAMLRNNKISQKEYDKAVASDLKLNLKPVQSGCVAANFADYFCSYVQHAIMQSDAFGKNAEERAKLLARGGLTIKTTLDSRLQKEAQRQIQRQVPKGDPSGVGSAMVSVEPGSGKILAMAQNTDYNPAKGRKNTELNFNVDPDMGGTSYGFQPGSTMKPFTTVAWLESGRSLNAVIDARRTSYPAGYPWRASCLPDGAYFQAWDFKNALPGYQRSMTVSQGLTWSVNSATAAQAAMLDLCDIRDAASRMGVHRAVDGEPIQVNTPSFIIGGQEVSPLTMAAAFATFASGGTYCEPIALSSVKDAQGNKYKVPEKQCDRAISPEVAAAVSIPLANLVNNSPGYMRPIGVPAAAKTGTTDLSEQTWTVGYTTGISTASWVGNWKSHTSMNGIAINGVAREYVDGATIAGAQWTDYMSAVAPLYPSGSFGQVPDSMKGSPQPSQPDPDEDEESEASGPDNEGNAGNGNGGDNAEAAGQEEAGNGGGTTAGDGDGGNAEASGPEQGGGSAASQDGADAGADSGADGNN
ncbi:transglycosylase domain-containing protein [Arthrobacter mobilis]|uniref:Penicillin-binding protein n=1 Tax=Arthrobacter mobilis TaxID=2724944 RepID=A0A7X6HE08_9MICC|nr:transglycosylase domain-containing protein [Arthrobacter mobilis]NKX55276.1 penicillin-binding protein [Arthrobacter mobilis]